MYHSLNIQQLLLAHNSVLPISSHKVRIFLIWLFANCRRWHSDMCLLTAKQFWSKQQKMIASKSLLSSVASLLLFSNSATSVALPTESVNSHEILPREIRILEIDVSRACKFSYGSGFSAQAVGNGCNDWVCVKGNTRYGVDLNNWCRVSLEEGDCSFYASCNNGVYSWRCNYDCTE